MVVIVIAMVMLVVILVVAPEELDQSLNLFQKRSQAESANLTTSPNHLKTIKKNNKNLKLYNKKMKFKKMIINNNNKPAKPTAIIVEHQLDMPEILCESVRLQQSILYFCHYL